MVTRISMDPGKIDENLAFFKSDVAPSDESLTRLSRDAQHDGPLDWGGHRRDCLV